MESIIQQETSLTIGSEVDILDEVKMKDDRMWCKLHIYLRLSQFKHYLDHCMPTSIQYTVSIMAPYF